MLDGFANEGEGLGELLFLALESTPCGHELLRRLVQSSLTMPIDAIATYNSLLPKARTYSSNQKGSISLESSSSPGSHRDTPVFLHFVLRRHRVGPEPARPRAAAPATASQSGFAPLDALLKDAVEKGNAPGAVLLVGHNGAVVYRKAYGHSSLEPTKEPMTLDTVFDMASLTKVLATTTCVMRMVQLGQVKLNDPVAKYIPEFAQNGKTGCDRPPIDDALLRTASRHRLEAVLAGRRRRIRTRQC